MVFSCWNKLGDSCLLRYTHQQENLDQYCRLSVKLRRSLWWMWTYLQLLRQQRSENDLLPFILSFLRILTILTSGSPCNFVILFWFSHIHIHYGIVICEPHKISTIWLKKLLVRKMKPMSSSFHAKMCFEFNQLAFAIKMERLTR